MSTLAIEGSEAPVTTGGRPGQAPLALRYADVILLVLALPIFVIAELPLAGYFACALAWFAQHAVLALADTRIRRALAEGDRRLALGIAGGSTFARLWLVTGAILLVGLLGDREDGLAAALLAVALVTLHLACLAASKLLYPEAQG